MKRFGIVIAVLLVAAGAVYIWQSAGCYSEQALFEDAAFKKAVAAGTQRALRQYLETGPQDPLAREALRRLDDLVYKGALRKGSKPGLQAYLAAWPRGRHAAGAGKKIAALDKKINRLKRRIEHRKKRLAAMKSGLSPVETVLDEYRLKITRLGGDPNDTVSVEAGPKDMDLNLYNKLVREYNGLLKDYQPKYDSYMALKDSTNKDVLLVNRTLGVR
ncbi:MAG: hypothetical protein U9P14_09875 [Gemmatimonadota bacterium]|nr:hypothetical protein [Gemmatimonadota bacterium]